MPAGRADSTAGFIDAVYRDESRRVLATLIRLLDQHWDLGGGVEREKVLLLVLTLQEVHREHLVLQAELVEQPDNTQCAGRGCSV